MRNITKWMLVILIGTAVAACTDDDDDDTTDTEGLHSFCSFGRNCQRFCPDNVYRYETG